MRKVLLLLIGAGIFQISANVNARSCINLSNYFVQSTAKAPSLPHRLILYDCKGICYFLPKDMTSTRTVPGFHSYIHKPLGCYCLVCLTKIKLDLFTKWYGLLLIIPLPILLIGIRHLKHVFTYTNIDSIIRCFSSPPNLGIENNKWKIFGSLTHHVHINHY
jgi:hypothetical protein